MTISMPIRRRDKYTLMRKGGKFMAMIVE